MYFIDGVHPQHNSLPSYGWLPKGEETKLKSNAGRQRTNISGALDAETHEVIVGSFSKSKFCTTSTMRPLLNLERHVLLFLKRKTFAGIASNWIRY